jgi:hypothetical protein
MRNHRIPFAALALTGLGMVALGLLSASAAAGGGFLDAERDKAHPFDAQIRDNTRSMMSEGAHHLLLRYLRQ